MLDEFKEFYGALKEEKDYEELRGYFNKTFPMFRKLILCDGQQNIVGEGPSIITANYSGTGRDVIGLLREYDRQLYFVAKKYLFSKEASIKEAKKRLGPRAYWILERIVERGATLLSERMTSFEMIPVDLDYDSDNAKNVVSQRDAMNTIKDYLKADKAVVLLQVRKNYMRHDTTDRNIKENSKHHNYVYKFSNTVSKIALELYNENPLLPAEERINVPITPVAVYGDKWWNPFGKTIIRIGTPLYISPFIDSKHPISEFTNHLEWKIAEMLVEAGIPRDRVNNAKH